MAKSKLKKALGLWRIEFRNGTTGILNIKNQALANFINDNMYFFDIKQWVAIEAPMNDIVYKGGMID